MDNRLNFYSPKEVEELDDLINSACDAEEEFDLDELERYAEEIRNAQKK